MSTTVDIHPADEFPELEVDRPLLVRLADWNRDGAPQGFRTRSRTGVLLSLVLWVCTCIFVIKCIVSFLEFRYAGAGRSGWLGPTGLVIFDPDLPLWASIPRWLLGTWLCCAEDFAVAFGFLLIGTGLLKAIGKYVDRRSRSGFWLRMGFWTTAYLAAYAAMVLMVVNLFLYITVDRFASARMLLTIHPMLLHSVQRDSSIARQIAIFIIPLSVLALQVFLVTLLPGIWQRLAYVVCRPATLTAGLLGFTLLGFGSRYALGEDYGGFQHNAHLWAMLASDTQTDADFLPGFPQPGNPELAHRPKNVIVIVGESLGHNCMHIYHAPVYTPLYGDETCPWQTTPNLEQIVEVEKKGIVFENSYAISDHTIVSALALFASMNNHNTDNSAIYAARDYPLPNRDFPMPAASRWLQKQGYRTYFLGGGGDFGSGWEKYKNLGRATLPYGFDIAKDDVKHYGAEEPKWPFNRSGKGGRGGSDKWDMNMFEDAYLCIDDAKAHDKPFYMMLWNFDTHCAYWPDDGPAGTDMPPGWEGFDFWKQDTQYKELVHPDPLPGWDQSDFWHEMSGRHVDEAPTRGWDHTRFWTEFLNDTDEHRESSCKGRTSVDPAWLYEDKDSSGNPIRTQKTIELNRYLNAVSRLDTLIAKLYRDLEKRGIADDTLIVITGDHGQAWGHHNTWRHGDKLYDEQCRVPMIMINKHLGDWAASHDFGPRNPNLISGLDMWPSIMDVMGMPCHELWQGKSIFSTEIPPEKRRIYMWVGGPVAGVREGDYKYVWDKEDGKQYLFDMYHDPDELHNLVKDDDQAKRTERMHRQVHMWQGWQTMWNEKLLREGKRD